MKHLIIAICIAILAIGCAETPTAPVLETYNVAPAITPTAPAIAWWDMSDSTFSVLINKNVYGEVIADTASVWITAYDSTAYSLEYFGYRSGSWLWALEDSFCVYRKADSIKLQLTWWIGAGVKQTTDLWAIVRMGEK